jgi:hypothetical protein
MVQASPINLYSSKQIVVTPAVEKKYAVVHATVSTDETVPIGQLTDILYVKCCKESDGSDVTCTKATNVVTITQAGLTDVNVLIFAYGT